MGTQSSDCSVDRFADMNKKLNCVLVDSYEEDSINLARTVIYNV